MRALCIVLTAVVFAPAASADPVEWVLDNVNFADGGTATGSFEFDSATYQVTNCAISVSGGDIATFPPTIYTDEDYEGWYYLPATAEPTLKWEQGVNRQLRLTFTRALEVGAGAVALDFANGNGVVECYNCDPFRFIATGVVIETTVGNETMPWSMIKALYR